MQYSFVIDAILTCVKKIIPGSQNDSAKEWGKIKKEGSALREEIQKLKNRDG